MSAPSSEPNHAAPPHDHAAEAAHAWKELYRDMRIFACFLSIILLTVLAFNIHFSDPWNGIVAIFLALVRVVVICYFFHCLLGTFSFLVRMVIFTAIFFVGMVYLSMWGSMLPHVGNPIKLPDTTVAPAHH